MKRLLYLSQYYSSQGQPGSSRPYQHIRYLTRCGYAVTLVTSYVKNGQRAIPPQYKGVKIARENEGNLLIFKTYAYPHYGADFRTRMLNYLSFMFYAVVAGLKAPQCDILLASSPSLFVGLAGYLLSRLRRVPLVLEVRDLWPETAVVMGVLRRPLLIRLATWLAHFLYRSADRVIALTEGIRDGIINAGIPASKIVFVPNGVDDEPFAELSPERAGRVRERYGWGDRFVAIYVGTLAASDGLPAIVCAAKLLRAHKDVLIVFLGDGEVKTKLEAMVADHGLANVMFIPSQPKADVPDFIGAADVCLLPVKNHPFFAMTLHNKLFDYMADARPILAALPEGEAQRLVCTAGAGIAVPPEDEVRLTTALLELRADREARRRYGENGRAYVMAHYRRSHLAGRLAATLDAALDAKRGKTTYAAERHHLSSSQTDQ